MKDTSIFTAEHYALLRTLQFVRGQLEKYKIFQLHLFLGQSKADLLKEVALLPFVEVPVPKKFDGSSRKAAKVTQFVSRIRQIKISNLHYTRDITPKRVTSGGVHLRGLAPEQHSSEETLLR